MSSTDLALGVIGVGAPFFEELVKAIYSALCRVSQHPHQCTLLADRCGYLASLLTSNLANPTDPVIGKAKVALSNAQLALKAASYDGGLGYGILKYCEIEHRIQEANQTIVDILQDISIRQFAKTTDYQAEMGLAQKADSVELASYFADLKGYLDNQHKVLVSEVCGNRQEETRLVTEELRRLFGDLSAKMTETLQRAQKSQTSSTDSLVIVRFRDLETEEEVDNLSMKAADRYNIPCISAYLKRKYESDFLSTVMDPCLYTRETQTHPYSPRGLTWHHVENGGFIGPFGPTDNEVDYYLATVPATYTVVLIVHNNQERAAVLYMDGPFPYSASPLKGYHFIRIRDGQPFSVWDPQRMGLRPFKCDLCVRVDDDRD